MKALLDVLTRTREALAKPANDFSWSGWNDRAEALAEIDGLIEVIRSGSLPERQRMEVMYAPTGPIQEVSLSSGWSKLFLELANQFDAAMRKVR
ncbi:MAG: hypothetical protein ACIAQ0_00030 [Phycisphaerales bacterium JB058]